MADADLERFLDKIQQLNAFVALSERIPSLRQALRQCSHHEEVVSLARRHGFEIGRRWGEPMEPPSPQQPWAASPSHEASLLEPLGPSASLLAGPVPSPGDECVQVLLQTATLRLERIHSCGASSPPGFWYEQAEEEWVCLLRGQASVQFADEEAPRRLGPGDSLRIKSRRRHRVLATDPAPGTIWLALFWREPPLS